jgi:hypothetical protein
MENALIVIYKLPGWSFNTEKQGQRLLCALLMFKVVLPVDLSLICRGKRYRYGDIFLNLYTDILFQTFLLYDVAQKFRCTMVDGQLEEGSIQVNLMILTASPAAI